MSEPLFDPTALDRSAGGDAELRAELARLFAAEAETLRDRLVDACAAGDREGSRAAAHRLRGSAGIVGAKRLRALCADLESELPGASDERWSALTAAIRDVTADTLSTLSRDTSGSDR